ncbi:DUF4362 domain-containing protein [Anaerobacillus isosaccharinicus]|uniref:DUF4362 domain-containing protein n=1 Tax=Anaerobacillus isosaccharinicus TaxID=1532552 RepID=A0A7S7L569_9BACI|nr:DUF4362 domain-containing protein [Anaerobacillus isosaccharinicus]MBA5587145.1 DUF4362 domain-containing protein [Anaerobacillus isosaccharinicus]QOY34658.1 DUF4362 domain-containing protein [Anaerobacillus isosaccharinicus]
MFISTRSYDFEESIAQGDVVNVHGQVYNYFVLETFVENVEAKKRDKIRIVNYTIEGDPIFTHLYHDGNLIKIEIDNSKDKFGGNRWFNTKDKCIELVKEDGNLTEYRLENCDNISSAQSYHLLTMSEIKDK